MPKEPVKVKDVDKPWTHPERSEDSPDTQPKKEPADWKEASEQIKNTHGS